MPRSFRSNRALGVLPDVRFPLTECARGAWSARCPERVRADCRRNRTGGPAGCAIAGRPTRASAGLHADNGTLRRPHQMRPQLGDSAGRRSAMNREQRCAALGAVALPAGTTVGQGHLPASAIVTFSPQTHRPCGPGSGASGCLALGSTMATSIFPGDWLSRGRCQSTSADLRPEHPLARLVGALGLLRGIARQLS